jgi:hypothetical protein
MNNEALKPLTGMVVTNLDTVTALPVASHVDRLLLMRRVRRSMTNVQYVAFCGPTGYPGTPRR